MHKYKDFFVVIDISDLNMFFVMNIFYLPHDSICHIIIYIYY